MMLPSINMMSATADSTAVKSDELQMSTTSISDTTPTDIEGTPSDTIPALSKRELRRHASGFPPLCNIPHCCLP